MKISDLLVESADDVKLLLALIGHDLKAITIRSNRIKEQYNSNPTPVFKEGMITFLSRINMELIAIATLPQWEFWIQNIDGKEVMHEIDSLYYSNLDFIENKR